MRAFEVLLVGQADLGLVVDHDLVGVWAFAFWDAAAILRRSVAWLSSCEQDL